jgi:hypothetical protein
VRQKSKKIYEYEYIVVYIYIVLGMSSMEDSDSDADDLYTHQDCLRALLQDNSVVCMESEVGVTTPAVSFSQQQPDQQPDQHPVGASILDLAKDASAEDDGDEDPPHAKVVDKQVEDAFTFFVRGGDPSNVGDRAAEECLRVIWNTQEGTYQHLDTGKRGAEALLSGYRIAKLCLHHLVTRMQRCGLMVYQEFGMHFCVEAHRGKIARSLKSLNEHYTHLVSRHRSSILCDDEACRNVPAGHNVSFLLSGSRFCVFDERVKFNPLQMGILYCLHHLADRKLRRYGDHVYAMRMIPRPYPVLAADTGEPICTECGQGLSEHSTDPGKRKDHAFRRAYTYVDGDEVFTHSWAPVTETDACKDMQLADSTIESFVLALADKEHNMDMWRNISNTASKHVEIAKFLGKCRDEEFCDLRPRAAVWSFKNGLYDGNKDMFCPYEDICPDDIGEDACSMHFVDQWFDREGYDIAMEQNKTMKETYVCCGQDAKYHSGLSCPDAPTVTTCAACGLFHRFTTDGWDQDGYDAFGRNQDGVDREGQTVDITTFGYDAETCLDDNGRDAYGFDPTDRIDAHGRDPTGHKASDPMSYPEAVNYATTEENEEEDQNESEGIPRRCTCYMGAGRGSMYAATEAGLWGWQALETPIFDSIFRHQILASDPNMTGQEFHNIMRYIYCLFGRTFFRNGTDPKTGKPYHDDFQVAPFIKGTAGTGKSTIADIMKACWNADDVAELNSNCQEKFGFETLLRPNGKIRNFIICSEVKTNMGLDQSEIQKLISGETVTTNRKNQTAVTVQCNAQCMFMGNELPGYKDASFSISRRFFVIDFPNEVPQEHKDGLLKERILRRELPTLIKKFCMAARDLRLKYGHKQIWSKALNAKTGAVEPILPQYFLNIQERMTEDTNTFMKFCKNECGRVVKGPLLYMKKDEYMEEYRRWCRVNGYSMQQFDEDHYRLPFRKARPKIVLVSMGHGESGALVDWNDPRFDAWASCAADGDDCTQAIRKSVLAEDNPEDAIPRTGGQWVIGVTLEKHMDKFNALYRTDDPKDDPILDDKEVLQWRNRTNPTETVSQTDMTFKRKRQKWSDILHTDHELEGVTEEMVLNILRRVRPRLTTWSTVVNEMRSYVEDWDVGSSSHSSNQGRTDKT